MPTSFCHLHNHSEYSFLDGANRIQGMVKRAADLGMPAIALTDHGVMFGAMSFYWAAKAEGIQPIIGMEAYIAPDGIASRNRKSHAHLLLLAKNIEGYRNLCRLATISALEGFYGKPRIDHEILRRHSEGLISSTTCLSSEVNNALKEDDYPEALRLAEMYAGMFAPGDYYVELMDHGFELQARTNEGLRRIAKELKLPMFVTNDAHYSTREDASPHDLLLCIGTGKRLDDPNRLKFSGDEYYLKSVEEMERLFPNDGEALERTMEIVGRCDLRLDAERAAMPQPEIPDGLDAGGYLRRLSEEGLVSRGATSEECRRRLEYELGVIERCGFNEYMLLVREFAQATRERDVYFGVRGSAAGSLVAYATGITDVDPVAYGLTFERFLNPERVSMPDVDMDFEDQRRGEIIEWVVDRYGKDRVAQIVTFGTLGAKGAIKDVGRVLGFEPQETEALSKLISSKNGTTLADAYATSDFRQAVNASARARQLYEAACQVEGISRTSGVHAAGIVIANKPLSEIMPLSRGTDGQAVTAYEMGVLEKMGMLKMDFLGLSNLTVLARAVESIEKETGVRLDVKNLPEDDAATWEMLARCESVGVFQIEGEGMTKQLGQVKPNSIRELAALIALYRPGPMGEIPRFVEQKFGRRRIELLHPLMEPILRETYGVITYQDQVLQIVQAVAGFSLGAADNLRRAMSKKDPVAMEKLGKEFFAGTEANGITRDVAQKIWDLLLPFAGYAFNKAHSVCYAILTFQTAYLKANYPHEYMAALLAVYRDKEDRVVAILEDCRRRKVPILRPDVNLSTGAARVQRSERGERAIRFGLAAIKNVGAGLCDAIVADREANGPYVHLYEFADRTKAYGMNRGALESLVKAGAFEGIEPNRAKSLRYVEAAMEYASGRQSERERELNSLFDTGGEGGKLELPLLPDVPAADRLERLAWEKEATGAYISDHPLRGLEGVLSRASNVRCAAALEQPDGASLRLAGVVSEVQVRTTRNGDPMCSFKLEDFSGVVPLTAFSATFQKYREVLRRDAVVQVTGRVRYRERDGEKEFGISLEAVSPLEGDGAPISLPSGDVVGTVTVSLARARRADLAKLFEVLRGARGECQLRLLVEPLSEFSPLDAPYFVPSDEAFREAVRAAIPQARVAYEPGERAFR